MALYDGHGLGGSRVAARARRMLLPLCALGAPARGGVVAWSRRGELQESYDHAEVLLRAMQRGFLALEEALSARYVRTHASGAVVALVAAVLELPPPPPAFDARTPPRREPVRRKLLLTWLGDAAALLRTRTADAGGGPAAGATSMRRLTPVRERELGNIEADANGVRAVLDTMPDTLQLPLSPDDDALVLCSDGVLDVLSDEVRRTSAQMVARCAFSRACARRASPGRRSWRRRGAPGRMLSWQRAWWLRRRRRRARGTTAQPS